MIGLLLRLLVECAVGAAVVVVMMPPSTCLARVVEILAGQGKIDEAKVGREECLSGPLARRRWGAHPRLT